MGKESCTMTNKNKDFWNALKHNGKMSSTNKITFKVADNDELKVTEILFDVFMNIIENTSGKKSTGVLCYQNKVSPIIDKTLE